MGVGSSCLWVGGWTCVRFACSGSSSRVVSRRRVDAKLSTLGKAFGEGFGWKHDVSDSCEIARWCFWSHKSVPQDCRTRASYKRIFHKNMCPTRVSPTRLSDKNVLQDCPTNDIQECATRVSHKSVNIRVCIGVRGFYLVEQRLFALILVVGYFGEP